MRPFAVFRGLSEILNPKLVLDFNRGSEIEDTLLATRHPTLDTQPSSLATRHPSPMYGFKVASYDKTKDLIIDPLLASTYLGGSSGDNPAAMAIDKDGNVYVTGWTWSSDFPISTDAYDNSNSEVQNWDIFVSKLSGDLTTLLASTFLGNDAKDHGNSIAIDKDGNIFVAGLTYSHSFPTTPDAFDTTWDDVAYNYHNGFISKLNGDLTQLLVSTYFGGSVSNGTSISSTAVDSEGNVYVTGTTYSPDFPVTEGAFDTSKSNGSGAFISRFNGNLTTLLASTFLEGDGSGSDESYAITLDTAGNVYVTGTTLSSDFPTTIGVYDTSYNGFYRLGDVFVSKLNGSLTELLASTFLGGAKGEYANSLAMDRSGNIYVAGWTHSSDFPVSTDAYDTQFDGDDGTYWTDPNGDVFVSKLSGDLKELLASTYLGGSAGENGRATIDTVGNVYVVGSTNSSDFPVTADAFQFSPGDSSSNTNDGFISKLNRKLNTLYTSTYLGDSADDSVSGISIKSTGDIYVVGQTGSSGFPTTSGAYDTSFNGYVFISFVGGAGDAFVSRFNLPTSYCNADSLSISKITPETGGDTESVTMTIYGCEFQGSATVKLARDDQPDIEADPVTVSDGGESITATFDLTDKARGVWDVVVTNPDGSSVTKEDAFTIEEGQEPEIWIDIVGRDSVRVGRWYTFYIVCGNSGNTDAIGVPICVYDIPDDVEIIYSPYIEKTALEAEYEAEKLQEDLPVAVDFFEDDELGEDEFSYDVKEEDVEKGNGKISIPILVHGIPAKSSVAVKIRVKTGRDIQLNAVAGKPLYNGGSLLDKIECLGYIAETILGYVPIIGCLEQFVRLSGEKMNSEIYLNGEKNPSLGQYITTALGCIPGEKYFKFLQKLKFIPKYKASLGLKSLDGKSVEPAFIRAVRLNSKTKKKADFIKDTFFVLLGSPELLEACDRALKSGSGKMQSVKTVSAVDPNIKMGTQGVGEQKYVSGNEPLKYIIYCENVGTATAAAAEVTITDQLGTSTVNLDTFSLGDITFGSSTVTPPSGLSEYSTEVDLRPDKNVVVRIDAALDKDSGLVIWHLVAIDPDTNDYPEDTMLGVLPPNVTPPEGDGSVFFTIKPKAGLPTGTEVRNKASIVFDVNPAMVTNEWLNTIDNDKPSSHVLSLAARQMNLSFPVYWDGTDVGAGVRDYTVYVSANGGAYTPWITNGADTASLFTGAPGMTYTFYSAATDNAGNLEDAPHDADTVTKINIPPVANAGDDQQAYVNGLATLNGSGSSDADGDALSYQWVFHVRPSGSAAAFSDETSKNPTFTPDKAGTYTIGLTVNDGAADSAPDTVTVTTVNRPPVADAGLDQTIHAGRTATLDGSGSSDPDGDAITHLWAFASIPAGSTATLSNTTAINPTFVADKMGAYTVSLVVNDGAVDSPSGTVTVNAGNTAPVAHAGSDQTAGVGDMVTLNGSRSADDDGDAITYSWLLTSRPPGSAATLTNANTVSPAFVVDIAGAYEVSLTVNDGFADSAPDVVTVTASAPMPDGLQALYAFNEGSGTAAHDASGNGRDGVVHGATWTAGKESGGLNFNGKTHYVSIPTINNNELSLCAWFNKGANDKKDKDVILGGYQPKTRRAQNDGFALSFDPFPPDTLKFTLVTQNSKGKRTQKVAKAKIPGSVGSWRHAAGVYDKETGRQMLYVDGKLVSTATHPADNVVSPLTRYTVMNIGCSLDAKGHYKGVIDDVRIYNRALSEQEINAIIQKPLDTGFVSR